MQHSALAESAVYLSAAVIVVPLFKKIGLGAVLGYLAAGALLGPWGLGFVQDSTRTLHLAELGVVLLLFLIGLELKPSRLWNMRYGVFGLGGAQVAACTTLFVAGLLVIGTPLTPALIVGFCLSLSSTAFALQLLTERKELNTGFGRSAFAILLFQDLVAIPVLALLPLFAATTTSLGASELLSVGKALGAILLISFFGQPLSRFLLQFISSAQTREVFLAGALLVVLGVGLLLESLGLSMALGAFLAGVVLSDSEYRHLLEADIEPFKGLLLGLFFIAIGTTVDFGLMNASWASVSLGLLFLLSVKFAVLYCLARWAKLSPESSRRMASTLPQGGEFAFVLFSAAVASGALAEAQASFWTLIVIASMVATPLVGFLERFLFARFAKPTNPTFDTMTDEHNPVIIAGFGRVGQMVARILRLQNIGFTTLERDPEQVKTVRKFGAKVYYGDASRLDLLEAAGAKSAKFFVLAMDDVETSVKTAQLIREHFPHLRVFARARNRQHAFELMDLGITEFWRETFASTMELSKSLLLELGTSLDEADAIIRRFRAHDEITLIEQHKLHHDEKAVIQYSRQSVQQLLDSVAADRASAGDPPRA